MATVLLKWNHTGTGETGFRVYKVHKTDTSSAPTSASEVEAIIGVDAAPGGGATDVVLVPGDAAGGRTEWSYSDEVTSPNVDCYYSVRAYNDAGYSAPAASAADAAIDFIHVHVTH